MTLDENQVKLEDQNGGAKPAMAPGVNVEEELAGTLLLFHCDPVTGKFNENIILSPKPTYSPNGMPSITSR